MISRILMKRMYSSGGAQEKMPSPHALLYRHWAKPVGKMLALSVGSYYTLYYMWEALEWSEKKREKQSETKQ